jgi:hypothetical protein
MAKATSSTTGGTSSRDSSILGKNLHPVSGSFAARKMSKSGKIWWKTHAGDCKCCCEFSGISTSFCISFVSFLFELRNFRLGFGLQQCFLKNNYVCRFEWRFFFPSAVTVNRRKEKGICGN